MSKCVTATYVYSFGEKDVHEDKQGPEGPEPGQDSQTTPTLPHLSPREERPPDAAHPPYPVRPGPDRP